MKKYMKKPIQIEAVQWTGLNLEEIKSFVGVSSMSYSIDDAAWKVGMAPPHVTVFIKITEGEHCCTIGDFIIKDENGVFHILKSDIFEKTYDAVDAYTDADTSQTFNENQTILELFRIMTELHARDCTANSVFQEYHDISWNDMCDTAIKLLGQLKS